MCVHVSLQENITALVSYVYERRYGWKEGGSHLGASASGHSAQCKASINGVLDDLIKWFAAESSSIICRASPIHFETWRASRCSIFCTRFRKRRLIKSNLCGVCAVVQPHLSTVHVTMLQRDKGCQNRQVFYEWAFLFP